MADMPSDVKRMLGMSESVVECKPGTYDTTPTITMYKTPYARPDDNRIAAYLLSESTWKIGKNLER
jgi:hypothetical protein